MSSILDYVFSSNFATAALVTFGLTVIAMALGIIGGVLLALLKTSPIKPLVWLVDLYVWIFRGTPVLLQLIFVFSVLPTWGLTFSPFMCAVIALSLNEAAYMAEIVRGGLLGVDKGQRTASHMLGLSPLKTLRWVVLPQMFRLILPPTGNQLIGMLKTSALASVVAVQDLLLAAQREAAGSFNYAGTLLAAAVYYLILTTFFTFLIRRLEKKVDVEVLSQRRRTQARKLTASREAL